MFCVSLLDFLPRYIGAIEWTHSPGDEDYYCRSLIDFRLANLPFHMGTLKRVEGHLKPTLDYIGAHPTSSAPGLCAQRNRTSSTHWTRSCEGALAILETSPILWITFRSAATFENVNTRRVTPVECLLNHY